MKSQLETLYARVPLGMRLGLDAMRAACKRFGHPEAAFPSVHVAGTNGKGSVCAMVESIARASGLKTGMYTSPHLVRFAERIRIDGEPLSDEALAPLLDQALTADLSFFETATLAAFLAFREHAVDLAIIEVGIGGRLDATNVLPAETVRCSAITKIAYDHMDKLGHTLAQIAREKAGIARKDVPLVHGELPVDAFMAIRSECARAGAPRVEASDYEGHVGLLGPHQHYNAGIAARIARRIDLSQGATERGLATVVWPCRFERIVTADGEYILDGAHNPDGVVALTKALEGVKVGALVFGALADKPWRSMLELAATIPAPRYYVEPEGRSPAPAEALAAIRPGTAMPSLAAALARARVQAQACAVVICGSLYLVGAARAELFRLPRDPTVAL
ncbi:MAG: folylpolyglutamate synthase/dihydrofolate synthase family protein [Labilithrix sp.]